MKEKGKAPRKREMFMMLGPNSKRGERNGARISLLYGEI
jgi:hypothetical protein